MYDLNFWNYKEGVYLDNQEIYQKCSNGEKHEGLETLPIDEIIKEIMNEFINWEIDDAGSSFTSPDEKSLFQIYHTDQFIRYDCSYSMKGEDMNRIIDVMSKFNCPLYDPQVPQRYDGR